MESTPSLRELANDKSPLPLPPRPAPIRIPDRDSHQRLPNSTTSPRAALVAGLRSATDRRQREREQRQGTPPPISPSPSVYQNAANNSLNPNNFNNLNSNNNNQFSDNGLYAALYAKQQELLATSMLISQQQQKIQAAMTSAAAAYGLPASPSPTIPSMSDLDLTGSMSSLDISNYTNFQPPQPSLVYSSSPTNTHHRTLSGNKYSAAFSPSASPIPIHSHGYSNSLSGLEYSSSFSDYAPEFSPLYQRNQYTSSSPKSHPPGLFNRPSSPSLPVRPQSSSSFRSSLFLNSDSKNQQPSSNSSHQQLQPQQQFQQHANQSSPNINSFNSPPPSSSFRRGHRKASSLSSSVYKSTLTNPPHSFNRTSGLSSNRSAASSDYEIPWRQPQGPPPLDEIKQRRELNFARRRINP